MDRDASAGENSTSAKGGQMWGTAVMVGMERLRSGPPAGMILFLIIEGIRRRDISLRIKERIYQVAFVLLVLFAVMIIYNDLAKTIPGLGGRLPWAVGRKRFGRGMMSPSPAALYPLRPPCPLCQIPGVR
jgi:hypothetical protein